MTRPLMEKMKVAIKSMRIRLAMKCCSLRADARRDPQADDRVCKNGDQRGADAGHNESEVGDA